MPMSFRNRRRRPLSLRERARVRGHEESLLFRPRRTDRHPRNKSFRIEHASYCHAPHPDPLPKGEGVCRSSCHVMRRLSPRPRPSTFLPVTHSPPADPILHVDRLGKKFKIYSSPWARAAEWLSLSRSKRHEDFWALRDVSFALDKGESLGVIAVTCPRKSPPLKNLTGPLCPPEGTFALRGRVLSLLELGPGVNQQLTGRQNVITSSRLLDFPQGYAESKIAEIEEFADLPAG